MVTSTVWVAPWAVCVRRAVPCLWAAWNCCCGAWKCNLGRRSAMQAADADATARGGRDAARSAACGSDRAS
eukprot:2270306-Prymnesium_polylepis.1